MSQLRGPIQPVHFIHGAQNGRVRAFANRIRELAAEHPEFSVHVCFSNPSPEDQVGVAYHSKGRIDTSLVTALGGPGFRVTYPNGDQTAYVTIVYEARPVGGVERADGDEVLELGWFRRNELVAIDLGAIALATLRELGWLPS